MFRSWVAHGVPLPPGIVTFVRYLTHSEYTTTHSGVTVFLYCMIKQPYPSPKKPLPGKKPYPMPIIKPGKPGIKKPGKPGVKPYPMPIIKPGKPGIVRPY